MFSESERMRQAPTLVERSLRLTQAKADSLLFDLFVNTLGSANLPIGIFGLKGVRPLARIRDRSDWSRLIRLGFEKDYAIHLMGVLGSQTDKCESVWNVGAAQGLYTLLAGIMLPKADIYAFEPDPDSFDRLKENVALNKLDNVRVNSIALGAENAAQRLNTDGCNGKAPSFHKHERHEGSIVVEVNSGDWLIWQQGFKPPDTLIIDVEGYEGPVLAGLTETMARRPPKHVFLEMHPDSWMPSGYQADQILSMLTDKGFEIAKVFERNNQKLYHFIRGR